MQGEGAAANIASALEALDRDGGCDVIIVARGGGSLEDLWAFNEEAVARAIYACKTPVVSGVGHETDETIADYVADVRAPTPSAAAELIAPDVRDLRSTVVHFLQKMDRGLTGQLQQERNGVDRLRRQLEAGLPDIGTLRRRIDDLSRIAGASVVSLAKQRRLEVDGLQQRLRGLDPRATLRRGFSIVELVASDSALTSVDQASGGGRVAHHSDRWSVARGGRNGQPGNDGGAAGAGAFEDSCERDSHKAEAKWQGDTATGIGETSVVRFPSRRGCGLV